MADQNEIPRDLTPIEIWQRMFLCSLAAPYIVGFACAQQFAGMLMPSATSSVTGTEPAASVDADSFAAGMDFLIGETYTAPIESQATAPSRDVLQMPDKSDSTSRKAMAIAA
jgi:hypothetical protein